ncbi:MAG: class I SAM-dependent methyltransferase [Acidobacteriota bacterium]|nr:class I SAM-dependent methyltransferase [Acidobacteriota bacterium]
MNVDEYQKMYELENRYWWFIGRRKLLHRVLASHHIENKQHLLFDLGCGTGLNLVSFAKDCNVVGGDRSLEALNFCRVRNVDTVVQCHADAIPLRSGSVDVVTALDVLEHFKDDLNALKEIHRILKPGGLLISTVPAYGFLWSEHDEALHHHRRYTSGQIKAKLSLSGFELERISYYISILFFPILMFRLWQKLTGISHSPSVSYIMPPAWINGFFVWLLSIESRIMSVIDLPFGISIIAIARRPTEPVESFG